MAYITVCDDVSVLLARTKYLMDSESIPKDRSDQAAHYKRVYNKEIGKGSADEYIEVYLNYDCASLVDAALGCDDKEGRACYRMTGGQQFARLQSERLNFS